MPYQTIFQIDYRALEWWPSAVMFAFALTLFLYGRSIKANYNPNKKLFTYCFSAVVLLFGLLLLIGLGGRFYSAYRDFKAGNVEVIQGYVEGFHPMPARGGEYETFCVHDVKFQYSDFESNPGFHQTSSHGGPIRGGLLVRITYIPDTDNSPERNIIVKLEIAKGAGS